jgi:hypothetical protein
MNAVQVWTIVASCFFALACVELYWRLRKNESIGRALRNWLGKIVDILSG